MQKPIRLFINLAKQNYLDMRNMIIIIGVMIGLIYATLPSNAQNTTEDPDGYYGTVITPEDDTPEEGGEPTTDTSPEGNRVPSVSIYCVLTRSGLEFDVPVFGIISYEIYDSEGVCIANYSHEYGFISYFFSLPPGEYKIRFVTNSCIYSGYIVK